MVRRAVTLIADSFRSPLRGPALTSRLGLALAVTFGVCFVTGLLSHLIQHPPGWFGWPTRPVHLYRVTQGVHVATGLATVPLLGAKLWSVYPRLFTWPPARGAAHAAERAGVALLVSTALFQLVTGVLNIAQRYSLMPFYFPTAHYWTAWLVVGAMLVHIGVKLPLVRGGLARHPSAATDPPTAPGGLGRRGLLGGVVAASGVITLATVGQTVAPLAPIAVLLRRRPGTGPQGLPVNKTAGAAGVREAALDPAYRLVVSGPGGRRALSLTDLGALPQQSVDLPIACVEGWSAGATWTGVRVRDLAALVGGDARTGVRVESLQRGGRYRVSELPPSFAWDPLTLLALRLGGGPLHLDHGYPARLIAPNRPGVLQTKWVGRITVLGAP